MEQATSLKPHRWTREEYDRMVDVGLLGRHTRVELLDGVIVEMSPEGEHHRNVMTALLSVLAPVAAATRLAANAPLAVGPYSLPEPDLAVVGLPDPGGHPTTARLAIEIVVTQQRAARVKIGIYAEALVDEYWIVDVPRRAIEVFAKPTPDGYEEHRTLTGDDRLAVPEFEIETAVADVFWRAGLR